jgi:hypothetical protein
MLSMLLLLQQGESACTNNPLRNIYTGPSFTILTPIGVGYEFLTGSSTKETSFTSGTPASDNWCGNETKVMGAVTEICCTTAQVNNMAKQFMTKLTFGLYLLAASSITSGGASAKAAQDFVASCKFKTSYAISNLANEIATKANRSINGLYYAVAKLAVAALPFAQTEVCLACANDETINKYYENGNLKVDKTEWEKMLTALGTAANDSNNALTELLKVLVGIYK